MLRSARRRFRRGLCTETHPRFGRKKKSKLTRKMWGHRIEGIAEYTLSQPCVPHTGDLTIYQMGVWRNRPWAPAISH
jgi:hypothetical protein